MRASKTLAVVATLIALGCGGGGGSNNSGNPAGPVAGGAMRECDHSDSVLAGTIISPNFFV